MQVWQVLVSDESGCPEIYRHLKDAIESVREYALIWDGKDRYGEEFTISIRPIKLIEGDE